MVQLNKVISKIREASASLKPHIILSFLAIDLGFNTGIAFVAYDFDTQVVAYSETKTIIRMNMADISELIVKSDTVILEKMPQKMDRVLAEKYGGVIAYMEQIAMPLVMILPAHWKPLAKARKWHLYGKRTQHEEDAYNMMRYHIMIKYGQDIGDLK